MILPQEARLEDVERYKKHIPSRALWQTVRGLPHGWRNKDRFEKESLIPFHAQHGLGRR